MSSDHIERKHLVASIRSLDRRRQLIARLALEDIDVQILTMRHVQFKSFGYIADIVGLSPSQVGRRYKSALEALADAAERE